VKADTEIYIHKEMFYQDGYKVSAHSENDLSFKFEERVKNYLSVELATPTT